MAIKFLNNVAVDSDVLYVDTINNRVGIGTANPQEELHVVGSVLISGSSTELKVKGSGGYDTANIVMGNAAHDSFSIDTRNDPSDNKTTLSFDSYQTTGTSTITLGDNYINFGTAASSRMRINSSGSVGIGTTSPGYKLDVAGEARIGSTSRESTRLLIQAENTAGAPATTTEIRMLGYESRGQGIFFQDSGNSGEEWFAGLNYASSWDKYSIGYDASGGQAEYVANAILTAVGSTGNVGIGTDSPAAKTHIYGPNHTGAFNTGALMIQQSSDDTRMFIDGNDIDTADGSLYLNDYSQYPIILGGVLRVGNAGDSYFTGNVGIGTTSPQAKMDVNGTIRATGGTFTSGTSGADSQSNAGIVLRKGKRILSGISQNSNQDFYLRVLLEQTTSGEIIIGQGGTGLITDISLKPGSNGNIRFFGSGSEDMRIASDGDVGIGTTDPASRLEVDGGDIEIDDSDRGLILRAPNGTRYRLQVANDGSLSTTAL